MKKKIKKVEYHLRTRPVSSSFTMTAILGTILVVIYTSSGRIDVSWGVAFGMVFLMMFVASLLSIIPSRPKEME